jgi:hypothetical protein
MSTVFESLDGKTATLEEVLRAIAYVRQLDEVEIARITSAMGPEVLFPFRKREEKPGFLQDWQSVKEAPSRRLSDEEYAEFLGVDATYLSADDPLSSPSKTGVTQSLSVWESLLTDASKRHSGKGRLLERFALLQCFSVALWVVATCAIFLDRVGTTLITFLPFVVVPLVVAVLPILYLRRILGVGFLSRFFSKTRETEQRRSETA